MADAEIVTGPDGRATLRLPRDLLGDAPARIAALEGEVAALRAREQAPDRIARTGAAFEEWARGQIEARESALQTSMDRLAEVGAQIVRAVDALASGLLAKEVSVVVHQSPITFAPRIEPAPAGAVSVVAQVQLPERRERVIEVKVDDQGNAKGTVT